MPPQVADAQFQLQAALKAREGADVDLLALPWTDVEKKIIPLLGGAFSPDNQQHLVIALGLCAAFAQRLGQETGAFWFPNRDTMEGASLGFPDALVTLSPFGEVMNALGRANLGQLEEVSKTIRVQLAQVKFSGTGGQRRLTPDLYVRLFDAGFVQLLVLDGKKANEAWQSTPDKLSRDIRDALSRAGKELPPELRQQLQAQLVGALDQLPRDAQLIDLAPRGAVRLVELMGHLFGTARQSGSAPEEFWSQFIFPLLHVGAPDTFPPMDDEELEALRQGAEPLMLFLEVVPYATPSVEDGLLGEFSQEELKLPHEKLANVAPLRMVRAEMARFAGLLRSFDAAKTRASLQAFTQYAEEKAGAKARSSPEADQMLEAALAVLSDLRSAVESAPPDAMLCVRRLTEAEAASDAALAELRKLLNGPRLILA
ncbi:MAG: hypothetical protein RL653_289 [Pseudomonadota bacterium]|jgi:hypothetical protein